MNELCLGVDCEAAEPNEAKNHQSILYNLANFLRAFIEMKGEEKL